jgi:uncharacterized membrane protein YfcA
MIHVAVFAMACIVSVFGVGGGVFYVPLLLSFGLSFHQATNASLLIIALTGLSASIVFHRKRLVDWRLALMLDPVKDVGAFLGGRFGGWFGESLLSLLFAALLITGGTVLMRYREEEALVPGAPPSQWGRWVAGQPYAVNLFVVLPFCLAAGFFSGLLGIGGGIFMVPLMTLAVGVPLKIAVATSSVMVCLTGTFGFLGGALGGQFSPFYGSSMAIAAFFGAMLGPQVTVRLNKTRLRQAFSGFMFVVAALMVYRGLT